MMLDGLLVTTAVEREHKRRHDDVGMFIWCCSAPEINIAVFGVSSGQKDGWSQVFTLSILIPLAFWYSIDSSGH